MARNTPSAARTSRRPAATAATTRTSRKPSSAKTVAGDAPVPVPVVDERRDASNGRGRLRRLLRTVGLGVTRIPVLGDSPGLRWTLSGRVMPGGPIVLLAHRGRRTGRTYWTPVEVIVDDDGGDELFLLPAGGYRSNWYRNIIAGGLSEVRFGGASHLATWREPAEDEKRAVLQRYVKHHPRWAQFLLKGLARRHRLEGEPTTAVAKAFPLLALRLSRVDGPSTWLGDRPETPIAGAVTLLSGALLVWAGYVFATGSASTALWITIVPGVTIEGAFALLRRADRALQRPRAPRAARFSQEGVAFLSGVFMVLAGYAGGAWSWLLAIPFILVGAIVIVLAVAVGRPPVTDVSGVA